MRALPEPVPASEVHLVFDGADDVASLASRGWGPRRCQPRVGPPSGKMIVERDRAVLLEPHPETLFRSCAIGRVEPEDDCAGLLPRLEREPVHDLDVLRVARVTWKPRFNDEKPPVLARRNDLLDRSTASTHPKPRAVQHEDDPRDRVVGGEGALHRHRERPRLIRKDDGSNAARNQHEREERTHVRSLLDVGARSTFPGPATAGRSSWAARTARARRWYGVRARVTE